MAQSDGGATGDGSERVAPANMLASLVDGVFCFRAFLDLAFFAGAGSAIRGISAVVAAMVVYEKEMKTGRGRSGVVKIYAVSCAEGFYMLERKPNGYNLKFKSIFF